jgi:hypothetical protein
MVCLCVGVPSQADVEGGVASRGWASNQARCPSLWLHRQTGRAEGVGYLAEAVKDFLKDDVQLVVLVHEWSLNLSRMQVVFDVCFSSLASPYLTIGITCHPFVSFNVEQKVFFLWIGNEKETSQGAAGGVGQLVSQLGCWGGEVQPSFWGRLHPGAQPVRAVWSHPIALVKCDTPNKRFQQLPR